jgi:hypothetical protein
MGWCQVVRIQGITVLGEADDVVHCRGESVPVVESREFIVDWPLTEVTRDSVVLGVGEAFGGCLAPPRTGATGSAADHFYHRRELVGGEHFLCTTAILA